MTNLLVRTPSSPSLSAGQRLPLGRWTAGAIGCLALLATGFTGLVAAGTAPPVALLTEALSNYRAEGPHGWSFTQKTVGDGHSRVEYFDAAKPDFNRWTLVKQDGRAPTADERQDYHEKLSRRSRGGTAPQLTDQLDLATTEMISDEAERTTFRMRLKPGEEGDNTARFLRATVVLHKRTRTIESLELASIEAFSPTFGVRITEMRTRLRYSLPAGDRPSLLLSTQTRLRGRAFVFKSLDADLTATFSQHEKAAKR